MKFLTVVFSLLFTISANAALITHVSSTENQVIVDFSITDYSSDIFDLYAGFDFDPNQLELASYVDSDDLIGNGGIAFPDAIGDAYVIDPGFLEVSYIFFGTDFGPAFDLGQAVFDILPNTNINQLFFNEIFVDAFDENFAPVAIKSELSVSVPEPSTIALFALMAGFVFMQKRKKS
ncbi:PEP-CTERM sorting domain-containing protein [Thalassotalea agariperforans]